MNPPRAWKCNVLHVSVQGPWPRHTRLCGGGRQPDPPGALEAPVFARQKLVSPHSSFDVKMICQSPASPDSCGWYGTRQSHLIPIQQPTTGHRRTNGTPNPLFSRVAFAWSKSMLPSDWPGIYGCIVSRSFPGCTPITSPIFGWFGSSRSYGGTALRQPRFSVYRDFIPNKSQGANAPNHVSPGA
jgi:hypothetical protein